MVDNIRLTFRETTSLVSEFIPTITTPLGAEGIFGQTWDGNKDIAGFSPNARFYKPEEVEIHENQVLKQFYIDRELTPEVQKLPFPGEFEVRDPVAFANAILRMQKDDEYWRQKLQTGAEILAERCNGQIYQRMLNYRIGQYAYHLDDIRKLRVVREEAWDRHLRATQ